MHEYDDFAWYYDRHWGLPFSRRVLPVLEKLLLARVAPPARLLDICCGAGHVAKLLSDRGYRVTGMDISPEMIARARVNAPQAEFIQGDIRNTSLPGPSQGAYSVYHGLNHLLMLPDLTEAFWNVYRALEPGATFVFDVLTDDAYRPPKDMAMIEPETAMLRATRYDPQTRLARLDMCFFSLEPSRARRADVTLWERSHSESEVRAALYEAGFRQAESTPADTLGMTGEAGRVFFKTVK